MIVIHVFKIIFSNDRIYHEFNFKVLIRHRLRFPLKGLSANMIALRSCLDPFDKDKPYIVLQSCIFIGQCG